MAERFSRVWNWLEALLNYAEGSPKSNLCEREDPLPHVTKLRQRNLLAAPPNPPCERVGEQGRSVKILLHRTPR